MPLPHFLLIATVVVTLSACKQPDGWSNQIGGANVDAVFGLAGTADGRACLTGTFISRVGFGNDANPIEIDSGGYSDIFAACYDADGIPAFVTHFGVTQKNDQPRAIAAAPNGDVLVTGFFSNTFGVTPAPVLQAPGPANADAFVVRVDRLGDTVWARRYGGTQTDSGRALAVDEDGNITLVGSFQGTMPYVENGIGRKMTSAGQRDAFILKLDADGDPQWGRRFGGSADDEALAVAIAADGSVVVAGTFAGDASGSGAATLNSAGYNDVFVQSFAPDGALQWQRAFGGSGQEQVGGLTATRGGSVWLAGSFQNQVSLPGDRVLQSAGSTDGMLVRFDARGGVDSAASIGGSEVELVYDIAAAADGSLVVAGHFQTEADLAPGPQRKAYSASGTADTDAFFLSLDAQGQHRDALLIGGDDVAIGNGVVVFDDGTMAGTGIFGKRIRIGGPGGATLDSRGKSDIYLLRLSR